MVSVNKMLVQLARLVKYFLAGNEYMPCVCTLIQQLSSVEKKNPKHSCFLNTFSFEEGKEATSAFAKRRCVSVKVRDALFPSADI